MGNRPLEFLDCLEPIHFLNIIYRYKPSASNTQINVISMQKFLLDRICMRHNTGQ